MVKSAVYHKNSFIGEVDLIHKNNSNSISAVGSWIREIRISHFTPPSDRCPPLAVLHFLAATAAAATADGGAALSFKIESDSNSPELFSLYSSCIRDKKTAVATLGNEELHLVAMPTRKNLVQYSCFWGFVVAPGLYNSCLVMLNLRCLGIVFDLDETLIVANTTRSFEDRINTLQQKINTESDQQRVSGMMAEIKRYQDDKVILKQFLENDQVLDGGKVYKVQLEVVQSVSEGHQAITRPIIRLPEKNIILTRVNPAIRDTSVLVRLRPAWEDLKNYLIAKGRKRFEVYVCTLAERDYALEMWRLLDPQSNLINSKELLDRIVCVKPGIKKSLVNVFQNGICHPKMSLIIDDRWKVWDEKDQPRVHVVPAFAPYYAPQAEANNTIPVLCVARNVACNVRGYFFKEFDDGLLPHINATFYEDEMMDLPSAPDVGNYLISEDDTSLPNGTKDPIGFEGVADPEVERRLKDTNFSAQAFPPMISNFDPRTISSIQHVMPSSSGTVPLLPAQMMMSLPNNQFPQSVLTGSKPLPLGQPGLSEHSLPGSTTEEGEVPESDLDPNTRRRLLILQHGQDFRDPPSAPPPPPPPPPPFPFVAPLQGPVPPVQPQGSWLPLEEDLNPRQHNKAPRQFPLEPEIGPFDRNRSQRPPYFRGRGTAFPSDRVLHENERLPNKVHYGDHRARMNRHVSRYNTYPGEETPKGQVSSNYRDAHIESGQPTARKYSESPAVVLQDIVVKSGGGKVEFRTIVCDTAELQFSVEVWLVEEKIGEGCAKTRKEAQQKAVMKAIENLAKKYMYPDQTAVQGDLNKENGFTSESNSFGYPAFERDDRLPFASSSDSLAMNHVMEGSKKSSSVSLLKDLCLMEGYNVAFFAPPAPLDDSASQGEVYAEVEIAGQIMGKGIGKTWEEAKLQAAEEAHESLKSMLGQFTQKRSGSPRTQSTMPNKRIKQDFSRVVQRIPSSGR